MENMIEKLEAEVEVTRLFVYLATVTDGAVRRKLAELTQAERNQLLSDALQRLRLGRVNGRLGIDRFSLTANEEAAERLDIDQVEGALNAALVASLVEREVEADG
jgi:hypothetical protein